MPMPLDKARILIVDDEADIRHSLRGILEEDEGHTVIGCETGEEALEIIARELPDLVFLDIWLPGMDGMSALAKISESYPALPVIMISGHGNIETAVTAIRLGAHDFIEKPLSLEKIILAVSRTLEFVNIRRENQALKSRVSDVKPGLTGSSPAIMEVKKQIEQVAPTDAWVLITGENGTGKEIAARSIYTKSLRNHKPLVALNCAAIPEELIESELFGHEKGAFTGAETAKEGKFELAHQGTLFLDEIADMSLKTQAKILRILQEKEFERVGGVRTTRVDVRVIAATNKNMQEEIAAGRFREDLYYRLKVFPLELPPLKDRGNDILLLAEVFQHELMREHGFKPLHIGPDAEKALLTYPWPGNVRELRNFMERMLILHAGQKIGAANLPAEIREYGQAQIASPPPAIAPNTDQDTSQAAFTQEAHQPDQTCLAAAFAQDDWRLARQEFEVTFLKNKLRQCEGNISRLSKLVGIERSHLSRKLKTYGIQAESEE